jgi:hypothetical protein
LARKIPVHTANPAENDLIDNAECCELAIPEPANPPDAGNVAMVENDGPVAVGGLAENRCSAPQIEQNL